MKILRDQANGGGAGTLRLGAVREIIGTGNFRYVSDENDVRGDKGVYERDKSLMTVTGTVTVVQPGGNTVSTDRLVYDTISETIRFSGQCNGRNCDTGERTRIVIEN
jgi:lipopolysaccharide export system protein LptA